jgi:L-iditol 2-dehydrogenase
VKAAVLTGIRRLELQEVPAPRLEKPDEVLLRVGSVGVCGSDIHYYQDGRIGSQVVQFPFRVGHELSAIVEKVGMAVTNLWPGDRVAVEPAVTCGQCDQCRAGRPHTCRHNRYLGTPDQIEGCLCEFIVMPAACCLPVRRETSLDRAALAEPFSIGLYSFRLGGLADGGSAAILGCGPIGLSVLLAAQQAGLTRLYATDPLPYRLAAGAKAGATWTGNPREQDVTAGILEREPLGVDAVYECCGEPSAIDQAVELLKPGGRLILVGIPTVDRISFSIDLLRRKELVVQNVRRQNECLAPALALLEDGSVSADFMVTHRFPIEKTAEAFELVRTYADGVLKAMVQVAG